MLGSVLALTAALCWAGTSVMLKSLTARIEAVSLNTLRTWIASIALLSLLPFARYIDAPQGMSLGAAGILMASSMMGMALGDTLYIKSLAYLDVSYSFPIAMCLAPAMTALAAVIVLGEPFTWLMGAGTCLVLGGAYIIAVLGKPKDLRSATAKVPVKGVLFALASACAWTAAATTLKIGVTDVNPFLASIVRLPAAATALSIFAFSENRGRFQQIRACGLRTIALIAIAGIIAYCIGGTSYIVSVQLIGAGRAALLTAAAPLFILPMSTVFLKERPTRLALLGVLLVVPGVCLVTL